MPTIGSSRLNPHATLLCCPGKRSAKLSSDVNGHLRLQEHWAQHKACFKSNLSYEVAVPMHGPVTPSWEPVPCQGRTGSAQEGGSKEGPRQEGASLVLLYGYVGREKVKLWSLLWGLFLLLLNTKLLKFRKVPCGRKHWQILRKTCFAKKMCYIVK